MGKITALELKALTEQDAGRKLRDGDGIIGLVRVKKEGGVSVSFDWRYRYDGKVKQITLGSYPSVSMPKIRAKRDELFRELTKEKNDPAALAAIKRAEQEAQRAEAAHLAAQRKRIAEEARANEEAMHTELKARLTLRDLFERWHKQELPRRKDKGAEVTRLFERDVFPILGDMPVADISRLQIVAQIDEVTARGSGVMARTLLGELRQMWGFGIKRGLVESDPTSHLKRDDFGKKQERERVLTDAEIRALRTALPQANMTKESQLCIWFILATGCRVGETLQAAWTHIDFDTKRWRIPAASTKNAKPHTVSLSNFAITQLTALHAITGATPWLFPATFKPEEHVCVKSMTKQIKDRQRPIDSKPMKNRTVKYARALVLAGGDWTPHDLRRTAATITASLGTPPHIVDKMLNHVEQNRLVRIYQRANFEAEQAEGWRMLGERLELLTRENDGKIITANFGRTV